MSAPLMLRVLSASVAAANRAGNIIREIMSTGKLGVVDKVRLTTQVPHKPTPMIFLIV